MSQCAKSIASESLNLYIVLFASIIFGLMHAYYCYVSPFDLYQFREQIDSKGENAQIELLIKDVVVTYRTSEQLSAKIHLNVNKRVNGGSDTLHLDRKSLSELGRVQPGYKQLGTGAYADTQATVGHLDSGSILTTMLTSGALMPLNRSGSLAK